MPLPPASLCTTAMPDLLHAPRAARPGGGRHGAARTGGSGYAGSSGGERAGAGESRPAGATVHSLEQLRTVLVAAGEHLGDMGWWTLADASLVAESAARQGRLACAFTVDVHEAGFSEWMGASAVARLGESSVWSAMAGAERLRTDLACTTSKGRTISCFRSPSRSVCVPVRRLDTRLEAESQRRLGTSGMSGSHDWWG